MSQTLEELQTWLQEPTYRVDYLLAGHREEYKRRVEAVRVINYELGYGKASEAINAGHWQRYARLIRNWKEERPMTETTPMTLDRFVSEMKRIADESVIVRNAAIEKMSADISETFLAALAAGHDADMLLLVGFALKSEIEPVQIEVSKLVEALKEQHRKKHELKIDPNWGEKPETGSILKEDEAVIPSRKIPIKTPVSEGFVRDEALDLSQPRKPAFTPEARQTAINDKLGRPYIPAEDTSGSTINTMAAVAAASGHKIPETEAEKEAHRMARDDSPDQGYTEPAPAPSCDSGSSSSSD